MDQVIRDISAAYLKDLYPDESGTRTDLSKKYPRDFEVYMCALELVDHNDDTVDYFAFPVMPSNIHKTETEATSIQTSFSGITVFNKQGYTPDDLSLDGDFGRGFKLMPGEDNGFYKGVGMTIKAGYYTSDSINAKGVVEAKMEYIEGVKTGFGCIKILQSIIHKAKAHSPGGVTYKLYFYNQALGEAYLVVPTKSPLSFSQSEQSSNMIWKYQLNLSIIADLNDVKNNRKAKGSLQSSLSPDASLAKASNKKELAQYKDSTAEYQAAGYSPSSKFR